MPTGPDATLAETKEALSEVQGLLTEQGGHHCGDRAPSRAPHRSWKRSRKRRRFRPHEQRHPPPTATGSRGGWLVSEGGIGPIP